MVLRAKNFSFPGFEGIPIYDVVLFFVKGLQKGALTTRASAIAFHLFLALLPAIIYFFTLIPHFPIENFEEGLLNLLQDIMPLNAYELFESTLRDMFIPRAGLSFFGFIIALFFATNAINGMIVAFNATYHTIETRSWLERRAIAALLVFILFVLLTTAVSLIIFSKAVVNKLVELEILRTNLTVYLLITGKWIVVIAMIYSALSFLYFLGPSRKMKWRFYSTGSSFASVLVIITSLIFTYMINHFGKFNEIFGSIGTMMVALLWLFLNSIALLIGFELNASIKNAKLVMDSNNSEDIAGDP
jgi:membrane protein